MTVCKEEMWFVLSKNGFVNAIRPFVEQLPANDQLQVYFNSRRINREHHSPLITVGGWGSPTSAAQRIDQFNAYFTM